MQNAEYHSLATWMRTNSADCEALQNGKKLSFTEIFRLWRYLHENGFDRLAEAFVVRHTESIKSIMPKSREELNDLLYDTLHSGGIDNITREEIAGVVEESMNRQICETS